MNGATTVSDLALVIPELILVGTALALILSARSHPERARPRSGRFWRRSAAVASAWVLPSDTTTGFGGMIIRDGYSNSSRF